MIKYTLKTWYLEEIIGILDIIKNFCSMKDTIKKMRRLTTNWKKLFAKDVYNKYYIPKYIIQRKLKVNSKKKIIQTHLKI